jgi:hypothetical protein
MSVPAEVVCCIPSRDADSLGQNRSMLRRVFCKTFLVTLALVVGSLPAADHSGSAKWERTIAAFEAADKKLPPAPGAVLFVGSSSIRFWKTLAADFPQYPVLNRGFGARTSPIAGSSDKFVRSFMNGHDFEDEEVVVAKAVGLSLHGLDLVVSSFQRAC